MVTLLRMARRADEQFRNPENELVLIAHFIRSLIGLFLSTKFSDRNNPF